MLKNKKLSILVFSTSGHTVRFGDPGTPGSTTREVQLPKVVSNKKRKLACIIVKAKKDFRSGRTCASQFVITIQVTTELFDEKGSQIVL